MDSDMDVNLDDNYKDENRMELSLHISGSDEESSCKEIEEKTEVNVNSSNNLSQILESNKNDEFKLSNKLCSLDSINENKIQNTEHEIINFENKVQENENLKISLEDDIRNKQISNKIINSDFNSESDSRNFSEKSKLTLIDNDDNDECSDTVKSNKLFDSDSEDITLFNTIKKRNVNKIVNSDSDDSVSNETADQLTKNDNSNNISQSNNQLEKITAFSRLKGLIDTDSSDGEIDNEASTTFSKHEVKKKLFTSSEEDDDVFNIKRDKIKKKRNKKSGKRITNSDLMDNDLDTSVTKLNNSNVDKNTAKSSKLNNLIDSDSEDDQTPSKLTEFSDQEDLTAISFDETKKNKKSEKASGRNTHSRKSKLTALEEIQSETQRLERQKYVSLPYHRPKQRTLEEFLNRKKTSRALPNAPSIAAKLQMFPDILCKVAEEKEREAEIFFDSTDSEKEDENTIVNSEIQNTEHNKNNINLDLNGLTQISSTLNLEQIEKSSCNVVDNTLFETDHAVKEVNGETVKTQENIGNDYSNGIKLTDDESFDNQLTKQDEVCYLTTITDGSKTSKNQSDQNNEHSEKELKNSIENSKSNMLGINEINGSQSIDLTMDTAVDSISESYNEINTNINISSTDNTKKSKFQCVREQLLLSLGNSKPKLSGNINTMIDLTANNVKTNSEGVNHLMERYVKHNFSRKNVKNDLKSKDDDIIILNDENEDSQSMQPGVKMRMFKESLKNKIASERYSEWKKKEEEEKILDKKIKNIEENEQDNEINSILDLEEEEEIEDEEESESEDDIIEIKEKKRKRSAFVDDEAEISDDDEENEEMEIDEEEDDEESEDVDEDKNEDDDNEGVNENRRKLKRIIKAFQDDDDDSNLSDTKENEIENKKSELKRADTSSDMFSLNSLASESSEKDEYEQVFQQPASISEDISPLNAIVKTDETNKDNNKIFSEFNSNDLMIQKEESPACNNSEALVSKSKPNKNSMDLRNWLSKQTHLFDKPSSNSVNEEELLEICSGNFVSNELSQLPDQSQEEFSSKLMKDKKSEVVNPSLSGLIDKYDNPDNTDSQLMAICSGAFASQALNKKQDVSPNLLENDVSQDIVLSLDESPPKSIEPCNSKKDVMSSISNNHQQLDSNVRNNLVLQSSSEEEDDFTTHYKKKFTKSKPIVLSDDEDNTASSDEESEIEHEENEEDKYIDYDSEENEVVVVPAKNIKKVAKKFLDEEAELSESDWDSADEDEKGLDQLEIEEGDKEDIDEDEVRDQLGKIHMKRVLDEDQRNVKLLQEIFFEEGDLHSDGAGRERRFKWKNIDNIEDNDLQKGLDNNDVDFGDGEDESELRKQRCEQQKFIESLKAGKDDDIENDFNDSQLFKVGLKVVKQKKEGIIKTSESVEPISKHTETIHNSTLMPPMLSSVLGITSKQSFISNKLAKGSFLARGREELTRIASKLRVEKDFIMSKQNFAFRHISPSVKDKETEDDKEEEFDTLYRKRKSGPETTPVSAKKQKTTGSMNGKRLFQRD